MFVLPSINEGISNTILEAMATGLPVVAGRVGGNPELVADGVTGRLYDPTDPAGLEQALLPYLTDPALRQAHGAAGRARVVQNFSLDSMVERYLDLYDELLPLPPPAGEGWGEGSNLPCVASPASSTPAARRDFDRALLQRMNDSQAHRGPDGEGLHLEPGVGLGHRRLSIIDIATGQQPLYNEDGSVVVVFNGEIYNYQELIPELQALGHVFHTRSDTEVIVHAWEAWGERCVDRFRGMFAFALYDRNRETLFMARDRLGVKPLYYAVLPDGTLLFGSELKSLLVHPGLGREIDPCAVEEYFALGYVAEPRTIFTSTKKLPPAHTLTREARPAGARARSSTGTCASRSRARSRSRRPARSSNRRLEESIRLRMISEVPLGAFLSGGVDSSAVVATMARISQRAGEHLLDLVRRPGVRRDSASRSRWPTGTRRATSSTT